MKQKMSFSYLVAVGFMLFALFFGAGNLIFPAMLGQSAGSNVWTANLGFIVTGVGLPLLGVIALGYSGKSDLQSLASRVSPFFGVAFTVALYLSIGPLFAIPRTATVSFEMGVKPYITEEFTTIGLLIFSIIFFGITVYFSLKSTKIVDIVGKVLTPLLLLFIAILIITAFFKPMGEFQAPTENYMSDAFFKGIQEGYLTMDALAAFVFGIIVINAVKERGATTRKEMMSAVAKAALIAAGLLAVIYTSLTFIGASSVQELGLLDNGGAVLAGAANHFFGQYGGILLSLIVLGACLTTSIGLITSCATYFTKLSPSISYTKFVIIFSAFSTVIANFGLSQLISFSVPVLVAIYPLAVCLMALTFLHNFFKGRKEVYQWSMGLTFIVALFDGLNAAGISFAPVNELFANILPLYSQGLGWIVPAIVGAVIGLITSLIVKGNLDSTPAEN
ncbi:branched-chain amino acid transport system II carrier protein [Niallia endozanthoxylica]|uniref:Branched-chain amino acid transport system carrier protein n=1 Tax=Niallia endozanthoxylica TaxID=2036016 RepID=A0A5J5I3F0_9BACI|nr:branched-chain amino acid transport system II carrier protein [Niallia endozanthoxylica]KAA9028416.1 branched-chain amino acid transport system II carrier protein [Niallia endozanthoxylica]